MAQVLAEHNFVNGIAGRLGRWSLEGMTALVTGGTKGIGFAIVEELTGLGASVHTCSRNEAELDECLSQWKKGFHQVTGSVCDINNVGTSTGKPTTEYTAEDYSLIMATNLESTYNLCQLVHPLLKASGSGSIILLFSVAGVVPVGEVGSIYGLTKGAMNQLAKTLACEWAKDRIRINSVAPWFIRTPLTEQFLNNEVFLEAVNSRTPMGRTGKPEEVSALVAFL